MDLSGAGLSVLDFEHLGTAVVGRGHQTADRRVLNRSERHAERYQGRSRGRSEGRPARARPTALHTAHSYRLYHAMSLPSIRDLFDEDVIYGADATTSSNVAAPS